MNPSSRRTGKVAFFVALNQLVNPNSWNRALGDSIDGFEQWKTSNDLAYFFLDAVDETRLKGQSDFEQALSEVLVALGKCMSRVHFVISSRPTDWSIDGVRAAVDKYLGKPIATALSALKETPASAIGTSGTMVNVVRLPAANAIEPLVVSLEPLSISEAKRLAEAFDVQEANAFWDTDELRKVTQSSYGIFAGRPTAWAVLRFTKRRAQWVEGEQWHPEQRATCEPDGSYLLKVPYSDDRELLGDILRFGADVQVLEPPELRAKVQSTLLDALKRYI